MLPSCPAYISTSIAVSVQQRSGLSHCRTSDSLSITATAYRCGLKFIYLNDAHQANRRGPWIGNVSANLNLISRGLSSSSSFRHPLWKGTAQHVTRLNRLLLEKCKPRFSSRGPQLTGAGQGWGTRFAQLSLPFTNRIIEPTQVPAVPGQVNRQSPETKPRGGLTLETVALETWGMHQPKKAKSNKGLLSWPWSLTWSDLVSHVAPTAPLPALTPGSSKHQPLAYSVHACCRRMDSGLTVHRDGRGGILCFLSWEPDLR